MKGSACIKKRATDDMYRNVQAINSYIYIYIRYDGEVETKPNVRNILLEAVFNLGKEMNE